MNLLIQSWSQMHHGRFKIPIVAKTIMEIDQSKKIISNINQ
jgi:hypothetical protein